MAVPCWVKSAESVGTGLDDDNPVDGTGSSPQLSAKAKYVGSFHILLLPYIGSKNNS